MNREYSIAFGVRRPIAAFLSHRFSSSTTLFFWPLLLCYIGKSGKSADRSAHSKE